jgi:hypothetical protein
MLAGYANFLIAGGTAGQSRSFSCYDVVEIGLPGLPDSPLGHARVRLYLRLQLLGANIFTNDRLHISLL